MYFIIQLALPRNRVFCGYQRIEALWRNTTCREAAMFETQDEAQEEADRHPGSVVCELTFAE